MPTLSPIYTATGNALSQVSHNFAATNRFFSMPDSTQALYHDPYSHKIYYYKPGNPVESQFIAYENLVPVASLVKKSPEILSDFHHDTRRNHSLLQSIHLKHYDPSLLVNDPGKLGTVTGALDEIVSGVFPFPAFSLAYASKDIYHNAKKVYNEHPEDSAQERMKKAAKVSADMAMYHAVATLALPMILTRMAQKTIENYMGPTERTFKSRLKSMTTQAAIFATLTFALIEPINWVTNKLLDYTYRQISEKEQRDKLIQHAKQVSSVAGASIQPILNPITNTWSTWNNQKPL
ncbi:MAG: hypothetical protein AAGI66_00330 [Cyanobacteria bacterium P01_H01_bin.74]